MHTTQFDQGWRELTPIEKVDYATTLLWSGIIGLLMICAVLGVALYQMQQLKEIESQCPNRTARALVSETINKSGVVECRYVRNFRGLGVER